MTVLQEIALARRIASAWHDGNVPGLVDALAQIGADTDPVRGVIFALCQHIDHISTEHFDVDASAFLSMHALEAQILADEEAGR